MPSNYILIERIELNASAASVTFANIPQTGYTDLKIVWSGRLTDASTATYCKLTFNGSATGFSAIRLFGSGSANGSGSLPQWSGTAPGANATSNTHSSVEINIPNYSGNVNKSYNIYTVTENNATEAYAELGAGLWSNTAAITSITLTGNAGSFAQYSTFSIYGLAATGTTPAIAPKATGGNVIDTDGTYWIHTFNTSGTFTPLVPLTCDYLVVAGGGGGGGIGNGVNQAFGGAGGGGAGGLRSTVTATGGGGSLESPISVAAQTYTITVGAGGVGGLGRASTSTNGTSSTFSTITSVGGGGVSAGNGQNGGSGGGAGDGGYSFGTGTAGQGFNGGSEPGGSGGAGGGGAGSVGANATTDNGASGGNGVATSISGTSRTYAGGGGGAAYAFPGGTTGGSGGSGGGGAGTTGNNNGGAATVNTGGGGGGASQTGTNQTTGGNGGSGIVIIRYAV